jgi:hypothetical protein
MRINRQWYGLLAFAVIAAGLVARLYSSSRIMTKRDTSTSSSFGLRNRASSKKPSAAGISTLSNAHEMHMVSGYITAFGCQHTTR